MKLLYMTVLPNGQFHPSRYDPAALQRAPLPAMVSMPKPKKVARPQRFKNVVVNNFKKGKMLGQGGQGAVYLGSYDGVSCGGKQLLANPSQELVDETLYEVDFFMKLDHPNCHYLLGAKTSLENGGILLLTELCDKGSLYDFYAKQGQRFDAQTSHRLARECAIGFDVIHDMGFMHRDIKSLNVFLSKELVAKVADFGMCTDDKTSMDGCGTVQWMAPEVFKNIMRPSSSPYNKQIDVYSYGILAWEIFHCRTPYMETGLNQMEIGQEVLSNNIRPRLGRACPGPIQQIITKCWDTDPRVRPSFKDVIKSLDDAASSCGL